MEESYLPETDDRFIDLYDEVKLEDVPGEKLGELLRGMRVDWAEPIDWPFTDGAILYLSGEDGKQLVLELGYDSAGITSDTPFYLRAGEKKPC